MNFKQARKILKKYDARILSKTKYCNGVTIRKVDDNKWEIRVLLTRKRFFHRHLEGLNLEGLPVRTKQVGIIRAVQARTDKWRPSPGGVSIGHYATTAGTLGCSVCKNGKKYILSNNHVLAESNDGIIGDDIYQPGPYDSGGPDDKIGELYDYIPLVFNDSGNPNYVDCALCKPTNESDVLDSIIDLDYPQGKKEAESSEQVTKSGRTTGTTEDEITEFSGLISIDYYGGRIGYFDDQIITGCMHEGGDSGSVLLNKDTKKVVGLLFAGSGVITIFNRATKVAEELEIDFLAPGMKEFLSNFILKPLKNLLCGLRFRFGKNFKSNLMIKPLKNLLCGLRFSLKFVKNFSSSIKIVNYQNFLLKTQVIFSSFKNFKISKFLFFESSKKFFSSIAISSYQNFLLKTQVVYSSFKNFKISKLLLFESFKDFLSNIKIPNYKDFLLKIQISYLKNFKISTFIDFESFKDFLSNIKIANYKDFLSRMQVRFFSSKNFKTNLTLKLFKNFLSNVVVPPAKNFLSRATIKFTASQNFLETIIIKISKDTLINALATFSPNWQKFLSIIDLWIDSDNEIYLNDILKTSVNVYDERDQSLLKFDLSGFSGEVEQARLYLYNTTDSDFPATLGCYQILENWSEDSVPESLGYSTSESATRLMAANTLNNLVYFDVTDIVKNWLAGEDNYGFLIRYAADNYISEREFASSRSNFPKPELRIQTKIPDFYSNCKISQPAPDSITSWRREWGFGVQRVEWVKSSDELVSGYNIYYSIDNGNNWVKINNSLISTDRNWFVVTGLDPDQYYDFCVTAVVEYSVDKESDKEFSKDIFGARVHLSWEAIPDGERYYIYGSGKV